ncbi:hypothetical protein OIU78_029593 [Salix suchowensis]|nr:hypothetical protein OIU78_029593 [Salix suchowensis]
MNHQIYTKYPSRRAKVILRFRSQAPLLLSICILQWELPLFGLDLQQICERGDDCN